MFVCLLVATVAAWFLKFDSTSMGLCAVFARPTSYHLELAGTEKSETENSENPEIRLMDKILHQLIGSLSHYLQGFIHTRRCRISSINSMI